MAQGLVSALGKSSWTHRKGGAMAGQWREKFTQRVKDKAKEILGEQLINWKYETGKDW